MDQKQPIRGALCPQPQRADAGAAGRKKQNRINLSNTCYVLYFVQLRIAKVNPILLLSTCSTCIRPLGLGAKRPRMGCF